jgi:hypothetical protein
MENLIQTRVKTFESEILPFTGFISNTQVKSLIEFNNTFFDAIRTLGVGELYARQNERQSKLKSLSANAKSSLGMFNKYNDKGIQRIGDAINKLKEVADEFSLILKPEAVNKTELIKQIDEFKLQCTDLEIKGRDVEKLFNAVDSLFEGFQKGGIAGITKIMEKNLQELITLRKSDTRGSLDNFPFWKVVAIIVALGVWIIGAIHCGFFNCSVAAGTAYFIIFAIAAIVTRFC